MSKKHTLPALLYGKLCPDCEGTGADIKETLKIAEWDCGYVPCQLCNGQGLDPTEYSN